MAELGFVGLGAMGSRMVRRLLAADHRVTGYNRTPARARALVDAGMTVAPTPRAAAAAGEAVCTMVSDNTALRAVAEGPDGLLAGLRPGATWVEMSTVSPDLTRELGGLTAQRGAAMLDAPVSGSVATLEAGQLSIVVGGDVAVLDRVRPWLTAIGPTITHVGPLGLAVSMKIATNLGLAVQMLAFSEAVLLAEKAGVARERAVEALLKSVAASPMLRYRGPFVLGLPAEAWFDVRMMQKDLQLALDLGRGVGALLPTTALTQEFLSMARGLGHEREDFAVLFDVLAWLSERPAGGRAAGS